MRRTLLYQQAFVALGTGLLLARGAYYMHEVNKQPEKPCCGQFAGQRKLTLADAMPTARKSAKILAQVSPEEAETFLKVAELHLQIVEKKVLPDEGVEFLISVLKDRDRTLVCHSRAMAAFRDASRLKVIGPNQEPVIRAVAQEYTRRVVEGDELNRWRETSRINGAKRLLELLDEAKA